MKYTHTHTPDKHAGFVADLFSLTRMWVKPFNPLCFFLFMYSAPDPDVADAQIPVDKLPRWDFCLFILITLRVRFTKPFLVLLLFLC